MGSAFPNIPLLMYQDPFDPRGNKVHKIAGNTGAGLGGILDFGWQDVDIHGTAAIGPGCPTAVCTAWISRRLWNTGTVDLTLNSDCGGLLPEVQVGFPLRLVD